MLSWSLLHTLVPRSRGACARGVRGRRGWVRAQGFFTRLVVWVLLAFMTPGAADAACDLVAHIQGVESCEDDDCDGRGGDCCPRSGAGGCTHCACCGQARALPGVAVWMPPGSSKGDSLGFARTQHRLPSGYRAPPFRPPVS